MGDRVVVFNFRNFDWCLSTSIEIIRRELERNASVDWAYWDTGLSFPREFPIAEKIRVLQIHRNIRTHRFLNLVKSGISSGSLSFLKFDAQPVNQTGEIQSKARTAAYLELISRVREAHPNKENYRQILLKLENCYTKTYLKTMSELKKKRPDRVYIYNGRFLQERAVADYCNSAEIPIIYFERFNPSWKERYFLFMKDTHSPRYRSKIMMEFGNRIQIDSHERFVELGAEWFSERQKGITQPFTKYQNVDFTNGRSRPFFVFFHSSEDELITTDLTSETWGSQMQALRKLVNTMHKLGTHDLIVRMHPNLRFKSVVEIEIWRKLADELTFAHSWISFLSPESPINSYSLINESTAVVTVGSTIGVEAAFMLKPSILIGRAFHEEMGITLNPADSLELLLLLSSDFSKLEFESRRLNAMKYAIFHATGGVEFQDVKLQKPALRNYDFLGVNLSNSLMVKLFMKLELHRIKVVKSIRSQLYRGNGVSES